MNDIETREDIEKLLWYFYDQLFMVPGMENVFAGIDLKQHMPHIVKFWSFVLLDEEGYKTNVFEKHLPLQIKSPQFDQWLATFTAAVDHMYKGEKADMAKQRATVLAFTFKNKWIALNKD